MNPLVSIITPTYNQENFIAECIESVLSQTYPYWEMIIIDDASSDRTPYIVEEYSKRDSRIKFIRHNENWGIYRLVDLYNEALGLSKGEYIAILEGDDFWPKSKLEKQIAVFSKYPDAVLSHGLIYLVNEKSFKLYRYPWNREIRENKPVGSILKCYLFGGSPISAVTVMIRKKFLDKIGGFYPKSKKLKLVDYPTWMELALLGRFVFVDEVVGYFRRHSNAVTLNFTEEFWKSKLEYLSWFVETHREELISLNPQLKVFLENYGYGQFLELGRLKILSKEKGSAKKFLVEAWKRRKTIILFKSKVSWFLLWFSANFFDVYSVYKKFLGFVRKIKQRKK